MQEIDLDQIHLGENRKRGAAGKSSDYDHNYRFTG